MPTLNSFQSAAAAANERATVVGSRVTAVISSAEPEQRPVLIETSHGQFDFAFAERPLGRLALPKQVETRLPALKAHLGLPGDIEPADQHAAREGLMRRFRDRLAGLAPLKPVADAIEAQFDFRERSLRLAPHHVDSQCLQPAGDNIHFGAACSAVSIGTAKLQPFAFLEIADLTNCNRPIPGDRPDVGPVLRCFGFLGGGTGDSLRSTPAKADL